MFARIEIAFPGRKIGRNQLRRTPVVSSRLGTKRIAASAPLASVFSNSAPFSRSSKSSAGCIIVLDAVSIRIDHDLTLAQFWDWHPWPRRVPHVFGDLAHDG